MAYSFDDGHIAVRTVHSVKHVPTHQSRITLHGKVALSVKYVAADLSSITTVPSGTDCQICHELRHTLGHHVRYRDIVPWVSRKLSFCCAQSGSLSCCSNSLGIHRVVHYKFPDCRTFDGTVFDFVGQGVGVTGPPTPNAKPT